MSIVYLRGFNSAPQSHKAQVMHRYMTERGLGARFVCPKLPHSPDDAIALVEREIAQHANEGVTLVGSSLGGFYATHLAEQHGLRAALLNPAVRPVVGFTVLTMMWMCWWSLSLCAAMAQGDLGRRENLRSVRLMEPNEITEWFTRETGRQLILTAGGRPIYLESLNIEGGTR